MQDLPPTAKLENEEAHSDVGLSLINGHPDLGLNQGPAN